jgi:hypothetical protein
MVRDAGGKGRDGGAGEVAGDAGGNWAAAPMEGFDVNEAEVAPGQAWEEEA